MQMITDFQNVQATQGGGYFDLPAGTYVVRIMSAQDIMPGGKYSPYLSVLFDVAEGQYTGRMAGKPDFAHEIKVYHSAKAQGQFKAFVDAVNGSNPQLPPMFTDDPSTWDETQLAGRIVGVTFKQRWYVGRDGTIKTQLRSDGFHTAEDVRTKEFPVPPIEKDSDVGDLKPGDNVGMPSRAPQQPAYAPQAYQPQQQAYQQPAYAQPRPAAPQAWAQQPQQQQQPYFDTTIPF